MGSGIRLQVPKRNVSTALPAELMEQCLTVRDALNLIMSRRDIGPQNAKRALRDACLSGKVRARHIRAIVNERGQKRIGISKVPRDAWQWPSAIDVETNSLSSFEHGKLESVQVNQAELSDWLSRQRRGPKAGTIARFAGADRELFGIIAGIMREKNITLTEAVRQLDYERKVKGPGSAESRIRRVTRLYKKERLQRSP
jgi:hypothetical protein